MRARLTCQPFPTGDPPWISRISRCSRSSLASRPRISSSARSSRIGNERALHDRRADRDRTRGLSHGRAAETGVVRMTPNDLLQIALYLALTLLAVKPLGAYMAAVFAETPNRVLRIGGPVERVLYRASGVDANEDMSWRRYATAMLVFNIAGLLVVYALQRLQAWLPLNPQGFGAVGADSAMNSAITFATNTNWQGYGGESTMSYLTQMLGFAVQNFLSAATGIAVLLALVRGFVRRNASGVGNFWVDMTRATLYVLLPLALVVALVLVSEGVPQNFKPYEDVPLLQPTTE